jgi:AmiR/NasT family two-component response regulator
MSNIPSLANVPVVVVTASDNPANPERASAIGAAAFPVKPIDGDELRRIVAFFVLSCLRGVS